MARYGIRSKKAYGVPAPRLQKLARQFGPNHRLALGLWKSGVHDARVLAALIEDPNLVSPRQMDTWAAAFDNWAICDACCFHLFDRTRFAYRKAMAWSLRKEEFVRRAGFALIASLTVHDKKAGDESFLRYLPLIRRAACDDRNFVKKAVNWALRQIGKRNVFLNGKAVRLAKELSRLECSSARWIAANALRELQSPAVQRRLQKKG